MKHRTTSFTPAQLTALEGLVRRRGRKRKASVTISDSLLQAADRLAGESQRSALLERALRRYLQAMLRRQRNGRDLAILNANADRLNAEAAEALADQAPLDGE